MRQQVTYIYITRIYSYWECLNFKVKYFKYEIIFFNLLCNVCLGHIFNLNFSYLLAVTVSHQPYLITVTWQFSGLQVIHNTMQYKCTTVGVAVQQYAVVHCDIDSWEGTSMLLSYTVIRIYLVTYVTRERHWPALRK